MFLSKPRQGRRNSRFIPAGKYDAFKTIDWLKDHQKSLEDSEREELLQGSNQPQITATLQPFLKKTLFDAQTWVLLSLTGAGIGLISSLVFLTTAWLSDAKRGYCKTHWYLSKDLCCQELDRLGDFCAEYVPYSSYSSVNFVIFLSLSALMAMISYLLSSGSKFIPGSGLSELKSVLGGFEIKGFFHGSAILVYKLVALPMSIGSGLVLGKEGPIVHLAASLSDWLSSFFSKYANNEGRKREIYSSAIAAAFACAFGAPISGSLVSLEGFSSFFSTRTIIRDFYCAFVASATILFLDPFRGKLVPFKVAYSSKQFFYFETIFYIGLGLLGAAFGSMFIRMHKHSQQFRDLHTVGNSNSLIPQFFRRPVVQTLVIVLATSSVSFLSSLTRVDGVELLESLFQECTPSEHLGLCRDNSLLIVSLIWALFVKTVFGIISYGLYLPGGYLMPAMCTGALLGRMVGECVAFLQHSYPDASFFSECPSNATNCVTPGVYSLLGSLAVLSGFTKLTVSLAVLVFELTGTLNYILPCMITLLSTRLLGDRLEQEGFLVSIISIRGFPFLDPQKDYNFPSLIEDRMTPAVDLVCLERYSTFRQVQAIIDHYSFQGFPLVTSKSSMGLLGYVDRISLMREMVKIQESGGFDETCRIDFAEGKDEDFEGRYFHRVVDDTPLSLDPGASMNFALDLFRKLGPRILLVKKQGILVGLLTKKDMLDFIEDSEASARLQRPGDYVSSSGVDLYTGFDSNAPLDLGYDLEEFRFRHFTAEEERELLDY